MFYTLVVDATYLSSIQRKGALMYNGTKEKQVKEKLSDTEAIILIVILGAALIVASWIFFKIHSEWIKLSLPVCILYVVFSFFLIRKMKRLHDAKKIEDWLGCGIHPAKKHLKKEMVIMNVKL